MQKRAAQRGPLLQVSRVPNLAVTSRSSTRGDAPARAPTRILVGGSEALNRVLALPEDEDERMSTLRS